MDIVPCISFCLVCDYFTWRSYFYNMCMHYLLFALIKPVFKIKIKLQHTPLVSILVEFYSMLF